MPVFDRHGDVDDVGNVSRKTWGESSWSWSKTAFTNNWKDSDWQGSGWDWHTDNAKRATKWDVDSKSIASDSQGSNVPQSVVKAQVLDNVLPKAQREYVPSKKRPHPQLGKINAPTVQESKSTAANHVAKAISSSHVPVKKTDTAAIATPRQQCGQWVSDCTQGVSQLDVQNGLGKDVVGGSNAIHTPSSAASSQVSTKSAKVQSARAIPVAHVRQLYSLRGSHFGGELVD